MLDPDLEAARQRRTPPLARQFNGFRTRTPQALPRSFHKFELPGNKRSAAFMPSPQIGIARAVRETHRRNGQWEPRDVVLDRCQGLVFPFRDLASARPQSSRLVESPRAIGRADRACGGPHRRRFRFRRGRGRNRPVADRANLAFPPLRHPGGPSRRPRLTPRPDGICRRRARASRSWPCFFSPSPDC